MTRTILLQLAHRNERRCQPAGTFFYDANDRSGTDADGNTIVYDFENHLVPITHKENY